MANLNNQRIVKICEYITKNYNSDGSRCLDHPSSFRFKDDVNFYKENNFKIVY